MIIDAAVRSAGGHQRRIFATIALGVMTGPLAVTATGTALASIQRALGGNLADLQWVMNAFVVPFAALLMPCGAVADRWGRSRMFRLGLVLLVVGSLIAGLAASIGQLIAGRLLQGVAGAMLTSSGPAMLNTVYTGDRERKAAFGLLGSCLGLALGLGALAGGPLIAVLGWRAPLLVPALFAILALMLTSALPNGQPSCRPLDPVGAASSAAFVTFASAFGILGAEHGWSERTALICLALTITAGAAFVACERRVAAPMVDLSLFRNRQFSGASALCFAITTIAVALFIFVPLYLQSVLDRSAASAGLLLLCLLVPIATTPVVVGRLGRGIAPGPILAISWALLALGAALAAGTTWADWGIRFTAPALLIMGTGIGGTNGLIDYLALSAVPPARSGLGAGAFNLMRPLGDVVAAIAAGAIIASAISVHLTGTPALAQLASADAWPGIVNAVSAGAIAQASSMMLDVVPRFALAAHEAYRFAMAMLFLVIGFAALLGACLSWRRFGIDRAHGPAPAVARYHRHPSQRVGQKDSSSAVANDDPC